MEVLTSGLIEVVAFPPVLVSPKLLQVCIDHYDVRSKSIVSKDGNIVLSISREIFLLYCVYQRAPLLHSPLLNPWFNIKKPLVNSIILLLGSGWKPIMVEGLGYPKLSPNIT